MFLQSQFDDKGLDKKQLQDMCAFFGRTFEKAAQPKDFRCMLDSFFDAYMVHRREIALGYMIDTCSIDLR